MVAFLVVGAAAETRAESSLRERAEYCANAMFSSSKEAVGCMPAKLVQIIGGAEKAQQLLDDTIREMASQGASIESVTVGQPLEPVEITNRTFTLVPQTLRMRITEGVLVQAGHLIAIRDPGSPDWAFIDAARASPAALAQLFPDTSAEAFAALKIPPREPPVLERR
jgi:hypothetical protein